MKLKVNTLILSGMILASIALKSCGFYSFSGTSIPQEVRTFSVSYFDNNAPINSPLLSQTITEGLKQKFISETNLSIEERNGDFDFSGEITSFTVTPVSAQSTDNAQLNRLTIQVAIKLVCASDDKISFEQTFSNFQDFDATLNFSDVEIDLVEEISEMLIQSIFNKAAINW
jgi:hypothetical protein